jgi:hypothetical protein
MPFSCNCDRYIKDHAPKRQSLNSACGDFWVLLSRLLKQSSRWFIRKLINPSKIVSKSGQNNPENRRSLNSEIVSKSKNDSFNDCL